MQFVETREIEVTAIHHIERAGFEDKLIQNVDFVNLAMCKDHNSWCAAAQIEQAVRFHRSCVFAKLGPGEKRKAQIDPCSNERGRKLVQRNGEAVVRLQV